MEKEPVVIRELYFSELGILKDLLYEAIFQEEGVELLPREIIEKPEISVYIDNFGVEADDYCLVADIDGRIAGAVWIRILAGEISGYGNIDSETPEFSIALFKEYRNKGIGTMLMKNMIVYMKQRGYIQASLSVNKNNYAFKMYKNLGFEIIKENQEDYLMRLKL